VRAIQITQHGGPEVLVPVDIETGSPGPGQIAIDVAYAGVNFMDTYQRAGAYPVPLPFVPGLDGSGRVVEVGAEVTGFAVGDRVAWPVGARGYAERVVIPGNDAVVLPDDVDDATAAALLFQGMTAHYLATSTFPCAPGDLVVVHAAAGGVGQLLTQIVKLRGGVVVGTVSTPEKAELARAAGVDHVVGYEDFVDRVKEISGGAGAAAVYDGVGLDTFDQSLAALRPRGTLVLFGASSGPVPPFELMRLSSGGSLFVTRPTLANYIGSRAEMAARTDDLFAWLTSGQLTVSIGGIYPMADARRAHEDLESRSTAGKLLLEVAASK
jgi:NADPH2:quinone reductase